MLGLPPALFPQQPNKCMQPFDHVFRENIISNPKPYLEVSILFAKIWETC
jgi:hypothetical protein